MLFFGEKVIFGILWTCLRNKTVHCWQYRCLWTKIFPFIPHYVNTASLKYNMVVLLHHIYYRTVCATTTGWRSNNKGYKNVVITLFFFCSFVFVYFYFDSDCVGGMLLPLFRVFSWQNRAKQMRILTFRKGDSAINQLVGWEPFIKCHLRNE